MAARSDLLSEGSRREKGSFGVLNNHLEMFGSALPTSMILLAATAALSMLIATLVIALILDVLGVIASLARGDGFGGGLQPPPTYQIRRTNSSPATLPMGAAYGKDDFSDSNFFNTLYKYMGIPNLDGQYPKFIPFVTATFLGCLEFFIGNSLNGGSRIPQITTNAAGYYVVVVRNAIRDAEQISEAAGEMKGGGFVGAIEGFFSLIDAFRSSATFRFAMVMVQIGDKIKTGQGMLGNRDNGGVYDMDETLQENSIGAITVASLHESVRMKSSAPRLTYSMTALPQIYLRPPEAFHRVKDGKLAPGTQTLGQGGPTLNASEQTLIGDMGGRLGLFNETISSTDIITSNAVAYDETGKPFQNRFSYFENGRIPTALREELESLLSTYYVPFYFHDLRTNEIIPLPVFVDSISDSFSPKWSEIDTMGRGDPVQIYGGTSRKIGFSFYMVATSESDYSALYYAVNRLVAMVYPQWSPGEEITNTTGQTFTVPYTATPASSPLVRIRLGELFASNRAPENVRRLFGANRESFKMVVDGEEVVPTRLESGDLDNLPNFSALTAVLARQNDKTDGTVAPVLIAATQLMNGGGEPKLVNLAGCDLQGNGGVTNLDGEPMLLAPGLEIEAAKGRYRFATWSGVQYEKSRAKYKPKPDFSWKIVNYYVDGSRKAKEKEGSFLKSGMYYVCVPFNTDTTFDGLANQALEGEAGVGFYALIPIDKVVKVKPPANSPPALPGLPGVEAEYTDDTKFFEDNILISAMNESGGRGLAGAITSLDFSWNEGPWETDATLGRAPKYVKVTLSFSPIHDEPLGINSDGSLRAAAYPVGKQIDAIMGSRFGLPGRVDPADKDAIAALAKANEDKIRELSRPSPTDTTASVGE